MKIITILAASVGLAALAGCQAKTTDDNAGDTLQANTLVVDNLEVATDNMPMDMNSTMDMNMTADNATTVTTTTNTTTNTN